MIDLPLTQLENWKKNPRTIQKSAFERLKKQLMMGQHSTLLVTPNLEGTDSSTQSFLVLGGNMRLRGMKELNADNPELFKTVHCLVVHFQEDAPDGWIAVIDNEMIRSHHYSSQEEAMMAYSLSHNDQAGYYDQDLMATLKDVYKFDWSEFSVNMFEIKPIDQQLKVMEEKADKQIKDMFNITIECKTLDEQTGIIQKLKDNNIYYKLKGI